jgi:phage terminase small subunit
MRRTPRRPAQAPQKPTRRRPPGRKTQHDPDALTPLQELFVAEYLSNGGNGTKAYLAASGEDVQASTAAVEACRLLRNPKIRQLFDTQRAERLKRLEMVGDEAIALLSISARADIGDIYDEHGKFLPVHLWPDSIRLAVKAVRPKTGEVVLHDGLKARELMAIAAGRLKTTLNVTHTFDHAKYLAGLLEEEDGATS